MIEDGDRISSSWVIALKISSVIRNETAVSGTTIGDIELRGTYKILKKSLNKIS